MDLTAKHGQSDGSAFNSAEKTLCQLIRTMHGIEERPENSFRNGGDGRSLTQFFHQEGHGNELIAYYLMFYLRAHGSSARPLYDSNAGLYGAGYSEKPYYVKSFQKSKQLEDYKYKSPLFLSDCNEADRTLLEKLGLASIIAQGKVSVSESDGLDSYGTGSHSSEILMVDFSEPEKLNAAAETMLQDDAFWKCVSQREGITTNEDDDDNNKKGRPTIQEALPNPLQADSWYFKSFDKNGEVRAGSLDGASSESEAFKTYQSHKDAKETAAKLHALKSEIAEIEAGVKERGRGEKIFSTLVGDALAELDKAKGPRTPLDHTKRVSGSGQKA